MFSRHCLLNECKYTETLQSIKSSNLETHKLREYSERNLYSTNTFLENKAVIKTSGSKCVILDILKKFRTFSRITTV